MRIIFGDGKISVAPATQEDKEILLFEDMGTGTVNEVVGTRLKGTEVATDELNHALVFEFKNSASVDVVLRALEKVKENLISANK